jgi:hypothetical protein
MLQDMIRAILHHCARKADPEIVNLTLLEAAWPALVGDDLARRTRPRAWQERTLCIDVCSHLWLQELSFRREELRRRIQQTFPWPLERISFAVHEPFTPLDSSPTNLPILPLPPPPAGPPPRPLSTKDAQEAQDALQLLDPETRALLERIGQHVRAASPRSKP